MRDAVTVQKFTLGYCKVVFIKHQARDCNVITHVSCYVCRPGNICLSRRPEGTNVLFLAIAYKSLIIHWSKNVNDSVRMRPALYKFGHTSQYVKEQRMERRERLWNTSQLY